MQNERKNRMNDPDLAAHFAYVCINLSTTSSILTDLIDLVSSVHTIDSKPQNLDYKRVS
jgi:hypothetical protein